MRNPYLAMSRAVNSQAAAATCQSAKGAFVDHQPLAHATSGGSSLHWAAVSHAMKDTSVSELTSSSILWLTDSEISGNRPVKLCLKAWLLIRLKMAELGSTPEPRHVARLLDSGSLAVNMALGTAVVEGIEEPIHVS